MIFIGGISQGTKILPFTGMLTCKYCHNVSSCQILMVYYYFSFFFIPLFRWNKHFLVKMSCCDAVYELNQEKGKAIARGEQVTIEDGDLRLLENGKNVMPAFSRMSDSQEADPAKSLRCPVCKYEAPGDSNYCPKCGQRLR